MKVVFSFLRPFVEEMSTDTTYEVLTQGGVSCVHTDPLKLGSVVTNKLTSTLAKTYPNFISGMFNIDGRLLCLLVVDGKRIYQPQSYDTYEKGTFIIYNDGSVQVTTLRDIYDVSKIKLAVQGFNLDYEFNGSKSMVDSLRKEYWCYIGKDGKWDDYVAVTKCLRAGLGYNPTIKKVVALSTYGNADDLRKAARQVGCIANGNTCGIGLDGNSMAALVVNGNVVSDGGGVLRHIITF